MIRGWLSYGGWQWRSTRPRWSSLKGNWVWRCDVTPSYSIQDGGALVVNILVFDLRVQLQHCAYQRKTLLFALIKVSTFICKRGNFRLQFPFKILTFSLLKIDIFAWSQQLCGVHSRWEYTDWHFNITCSSHRWLIQWGKESRRHLHRIFQHAAVVLVLQSLISCTKYTGFGLEWCKQLAPETANPVLVLQSKAP